LNEIYSFTLENIENDSTDNAKLVNSTYGEMTFDGVEKMIQEAGVQPTDHFYDLGSGHGRVTMHVFLKGGVKKAYGIEYYPERSYNSERALKKLYKMFPDILDEDRLISYQIQNIKDLHFLEDATVLYMCSTCYPEDLLVIVYDKVKASKMIRCIVTHKEFDKFRDFLPNHKTVVLPCTWNANVTWHIYSR